MAMRFHVEISPSPDFMTVTRRLSLPFSKMGFAAESSRGSRLPGVSTILAGWALEGILFISAYAGSFHRVGSKTRCRKGQLGPRTKAKRLYGTRQRSGTKIAIGET